MTLLNWLLSKTDNPATAFTEKNKNDKNNVLILHPNIRLSNIGAAHCLPKIHRENFIGIDFFGKNFRRKFFKQQFFDFFVRHIFAPTH